MADEKLVLNNLDQITELLESNDDIDLSQVDFSNWPKLKIKIEGDKYHGTITPQLAKALYDFVYSLKKGYAQIKYGTSNLQRLRSEDNELFDSITFHISEGCSDVVTDGISKVFDAIAQCIKEGFKDMSPKQKFALLALTATLFAGYFAFDTYIQSYHDIESQKIESEVHAEQNSHEESIAKIVQEAADNDVELSNTISAYSEHINEGHRRIVQSVDDADRINYSGKELDKESIQRISERQPVTTDSKIYTETVRIDHIKRLVERQVVKVTFVSDYFDKQITIQYNMGYLGSTEETKLKEAFFNNVHKIVEIQYSAVINDDSRDFVRGTLMDIGEVKNSGYVASTDEDSYDDDDT